MPVLTGALVDVSGSMERSIGGRVDEEGGSWARSVFKVVDDLIKNDVDSSNHVFALGVGASSRPQVFDLLNTLKKTKASSNPDIISRSKEDILEEALRILARNGAPRVRTWARMNVLLSAVSYDEAVVILDKLQQDPGFRRTFVFDVLPKQCRELEHGLDSYAREGLNLSFALGDIITKAITGKEMVTEYATADSIREVILKGMELVKEEALVGVGEAAVMTVHEAQDILHGCVGDRELTDERVDELMEVVKPFIYGGTPLIKALNHATEFFGLPQYREHHKLLFVLSDGQPADGNDPPLAALSALGVTVACCFITDRSISDPLRLYSNVDPDWEKPAKFMFSMSSPIKTELIPRTIFVKRDWKIDIANNETKLFCQVNHPDIIKDVCDLARNIVCCQDALSDALASVSLDVYINQTKDRFGAKRQVGGTCYANASAAVLHMAIKRIVGRVGGYPDFFEIRDKLVAKYGLDGANTLSVVKEVCPQYCLQCREVNVVGAMKAVAAKRPVIATFCLTDKDPRHPGNPYEWESFSRFFKDNPQGTLSRSVIDITKRPHGAKLGGHAVVLTSFNSECLMLMNSWGTDWGDGGFFRVQNADVLGLEFVDVFWTLDDLRQEEKDAYARDGAEKAAKLMNSLQGLKSAKYRCPLCSVESNVRDFSGHLGQVKCPQCRRTFRVKDSGGDLALNMYLTSLSH